MKLMVEPEHAGTTVNCPGCGTKLTVPAAPKDDGKGPAASTAGRAGWKETDPCNANVWMALAIGLGVFALLYLPALPFKKSFYYQILYLRTWVNYAESICFGFGVGILVLKYLKVRHQANALMLDVVPQNLGREINKSNIHVFIAHLYALPVKLRDSMMVNRIRKALELFEIRQVNADVSTMMENQSNIDGARIGGSFTMLRVLVWAIPILGFVGTVLGLSDAIGNFQGVMGASGGNASELMSSMGKVTSGLGTSFDTTLLALIYAICLSIPLSSLQKIEEDNLNHIDAYCNDILMPRLNDGSNAAGGDMGALADVLTASLTRAHTQFLTGLDGASTLIRTQSEGMERRATENQKLVQESFTKAVTTFQEGAAKAIGDLGKTAGESMESLSGTLKKAGDHVASLEKVAATQQAQIDASVKQTLAKLQEDSSKVIAEAMKGAVAETSKAIENTFKPAVHQVTLLSEAVRATAGHVATLEKQASEHQIGVQKALQESIARVQQDASKILGESIKAAADQSAKAMEEVMKPAVTQLAAIGATAKQAVEESAALQKQSREQHAAAQQTFMTTTTQLQRELSKTLEESTKPVTQHFAGLAEGVKSAISAVAALEQRTREQQASSERAAQEAAAQLQRDSSKALEEALRPAAVQLTALAGLVKSAADNSQALEKQSREQQTATLRAGQEAAAQLQRETTKALEDALRPAATQLAALATGVKAVSDSTAALEQQTRDQQAKAERAAQEAATRLQQESARALEEALRPASVQLAALAGLVKTAADSSQALEKQSREQQTAALRSAQEAATQLQRETTKALEDALRPAATQLAALATGVKTVTDSTAALERQARDQQAAAERAMQEAVSRLQRDSVKAFEEALRPAAQQLGTLGESVKAAVTQLTTLDRAGRDQQTTAQRAMEEAAAKLQRDTAKSLEDTLRPVVVQFGSLADSLRVVSDHVGSLDRQAREGQETTRRGVEENLARLQRDSIKGLEEALRPAAQHLATLGETVRAATQQLSGLDRHAQEHQATVARSVEASVGKLQQDASRAVEEVMRGATAQLATLQQGIAALNQTLTELHGKQIIVQQQKPGGVFSRMMGKG